MINLRGGHGHTQIILPTLKDHFQGHSTELNPTGPDTGAVPSALAESVSPSLGQCEWGPATDAEIDRCGVGV
jgi:hypothetical protein